jgi:ATP synthase protein I
MSADGKGEDPKHAAGQGQISPEDREAIRQRSSELGKKLDAVNAKRAEAERALETARQTAFGQAFKYSAELIVGVVFGGALGWVLDQQFGTAPWFMILLVILGFAAGLLNLIRSARKAQAENEAQQRAAPPVKDDDEDDDR